MINKKTKNIITGVLCLSTIIGITYTSNIPTFAFTNITSNTTTIDKIDKEYISKVISYKEKADTEYFSDTNQSEKDINTAIEYANKITNSINKQKLLTELMGYREAIYIQQADNYERKILIDIKEKNITKAKEDLNTATNYVNKITTKSDKRSALEKLNDYKDMINGVPIRTQDYGYQTNIYIKKAIDEIQTNANQAEKDLDTATTYVNKMSDSYTKTDLIKDIKNLRDDVYGTQTHNYIKKIMDEIQTNTNQAEKDLGIATMYVNKMGSSITKTDLIKDVLELKDDVYGTQTHNYIKKAMNEVKINKTQAEKDSGIAISYANKMGNSITKTDLIKEINTLLKTISSVR